MEGKSKAAPAPPDGFTRRDRRSPLTDPWEPIYSREMAERVDIGLWLREALCNSRGFAHGGLISALADNSMGHSCVAVLELAKSLVTVNLSVDFVGVAKQGAWLQNFRARLLNLEYGIMWAVYTVPLPITSHT